MSEARVTNLAFAPSKMAFTLDRERQCRALGHVFIRDFRHPNGEWEQQVSNDCFRCGQPKAELVDESPRD